MTLTARITDKLEAYLGASFLFDGIKRLGPTRLEVAVWLYDPEARAGEMLKCRLDVSTEAPAEHPHE